MTGTRCSPRSGGESWAAAEGSGPPGPRPRRLPVRPARPARPDEGVCAARTAAGGAGGAPAPRGAFRLWLLPRQRRTPAAPAPQARSAPGGGEPARQRAPEPSPALGDATGPTDRFLAPGGPGVRRVAVLAAGGARDPAMVPP